MNEQFGGMIEHFSFQHSSSLIHLLFSIILAVIISRILSRLVHTVFGDADQAKRWVKRAVFAVWMIFFLDVLGVLDPILDILEGLSIPVGMHHITVLRIVQGVLLVIVVSMASLWLSRLLERRVMSLTSIDTSLRVIVAKILQGLLIAIAVLATLPVLGIDTTFLSVIGGALGVGLGFGLQKIASNYVSGFIILIDRSVRLDDLITVDGRKGVVTKMEARYAVLKCTDGTEIVIPNENFVTSIVVNHTLNDRMGSLSISIWLAHEADLRKTIALLSPLPLRHPDVLSEPNTPTVQVQQVSELGIEIQLTWWMRDLALVDLNLRSHIMLESIEALREAGVPLAKRPEVLVKA
jgi:small-conductance mechanosensitive channel